MAAPTLYGDPISGNCLKVEWVAEALAIPVIWKTVGVLAGETRAPDFLALNPAGQVPVLVFPDGRTLSQSNAIMLYLAEGSRLVPAAPFQRARMLQWMFWEQYSHEPYIAVRRFQLAYLKRSPGELDPRLLERGHAALSLMESSLHEASYFAGDALSLADIALVAYTRMADEGGFDTTAYPAVNAWIARVEAELRITDRPASSRRET